MKPAWEGGKVMQERVKILTFVSGHGETVVEPRMRITSTSGWRRSRAK